MNVQRIGVFIEAHAYKLFRWKKIRLHLTVKRTQQRIVNKNQ